MRISSRLLAQYPDEMTIVLQHQYWDLTVTEQAFEVGLSFNGVPERLLVPFTAVKGFVDPSVQFGAAVRDRCRAPDAVDSPMRRADRTTKTAPAVLPAPAARSAGSRSPRMSREPSRRRCAGRQPRRLPEEDVTDRRPPPDFARRYFRMGKRSHLQPAASAKAATRTETDTFGPIEVPADRYWGAQTERSLENFPIGWREACRSRSSARSASSSAPPPR